MTVSRLSLFRCSFGIYYVSLETEGYFCGSQRAAPPKATLTDYHPLPFRSSWATPARQ